MGCSIIQERYTAVPMAVDETRVFGYSDSIGGFLAVTAGTITITRVGDNGMTIPIVTALPLVVGFNRIPVFLGTYGGTVILGGGASGSLLV